VLALCHGRPLIVPDLAAFADLPDAAIVRYDRTAAGLTAALHRLAQAGSDELAAMSAAAVGYAGRLGWPDIAARTAAELSALVSSRPRARSDGSMLTAR
jgi:hypothetical protein